jgi:Xaa-Pro aminopeptidase
VQETVLEMVKPGVLLKDLSDKAKDLTGDHLIDLELIADKKDTSKYYMHSVGHHLGLDTHDVGDQRKPLEPGCVITIEPGIYIQEEQVGIRIEDNILITKDGYRVLSENIPKTIQDIESLPGE